MEHQKELEGGGYGDPGDPIMLTLLIYFLGTLGIPFCYVTYYLLTGTVGSK